MNRALMLALLAALPAVAEIKYARVEDQKTATQAVLRYTAPDLAVCTVEVSESGTYTPPVHDVDPALFAGSNQDDRPDAVRDGTERTFVIGKRTAELASDGRYYSRALQQATPHYYRITCGADTATGTFTTEVFARGITYNEPLPVDPNTPGQYAYPTIDWSEPTTAPTPGVTFTSSGTAVTFSGTVPTGDLAVGDMLVINAGPQAGQYRRVSARTDGTHATVSIAFGVNQSAGTAWLRRTPERTNTQQIIDPRTGFLVRRISNPGMWSRYDYAASGTPRIDTVTAPDWTNGTLTAITSIDSNLASFTGGAGCAPDCPWMVLHPSSSQSPSLLYSDDSKQLSAVVVQVRGSSDTSGDNAKIQVCLSADGLTCRSATRELDLSACSASTCSMGDEWPILKYWNSATNVVASYVSRVEFFGAAGAVLVRKKTNSGTVNLDYIGLSFVLSDGHGWLSQSYQICSDVYDTQVYGGVTHTGYRCMFAPNTPLYFVDKDTGDAVPTTTHWLNAGSDSGGGWSAGAIGGSAATAFDPADPKIVYAIRSRTGGGETILKAQYTGGNLDLGPYSTSNPPGSYLWDVSTFTKNSSLKSKLQTFLTGHTPSFTASRYPLDCLPGGVIDDAYMAFYCWLGGQDSSPGWDGLVALTGASAGEVVAAHSTHSVYPYRFGTLHSGPGRRVANGWMYAGSNDLPSSTACGGGPFKTELAEAMNAPGTGQDVVCPAAPTDRALTVCTRVQVTGDLYKPSTVCSWENTNRGDPPSGFLDLQAARAGDFFVIGSERVQVVAKDVVCSDPNAPCYWTFGRAMDASTGASHSNGSSVTASRAWSAGYFDYVGDPYGEAGYPSHALRVFPGHSSPHLNGKQASVTPTANCLNLPDYPCYAFYAGTIPQISSQYLNNNPPRAGAATQRFGNIVGNPGSSDSHLSFQQRPPAEQTWMLDAYPAAYPVGTPQTWTYVPASTSLYSTTWTIYKARPIEGSCLNRPMMDVSPGPIVDGTSGNYTFCVGECGQAGGATAVYANCPDARPAATIACVNSLSDDDAQLCLFQTSSMVHNYRQLWIDRHDPFGDRQRNLGPILTRHRHISPYMTGTAPFDGKWMFVLNRWVDNVRTDVYAVKISPQPPEDSVNRKTFIPVAVQLGSVPANTSTAIAEFGYGPDLHCTSRPEVCVATAGGQVNEAAPFSWASESFSWLPCTSGCTVTLPAIASRVLYYRFRYRASDGTPVGSSAMQVAVSK